MSQVRLEITKALLERATSSDLKDERSIKDFLAKVDIVVQYVDKQDLGQPKRRNGSAPRKS